MHQHWKYGTSDNSLQSPGPNALKGFVRILQNSNFERKLISLETLQWRVWDPVYNSVAIFYAIFLSLIHYLRNLVY